MDKTFPDDLLIEILRRLPIKSLSNLRNVSTRWDDIISSLDFQKLYEPQGEAKDDSISPFLGFFQSEGAFLPKIALTNFSKEVAYSKLDGDSIMGSSNGLLLIYNNLSMAYRVCNPVTKQCISLPQSHYCHFNVAIGFDAEEMCDNSYRVEDMKLNVVCILLPSFTDPSYAYQMETFSSDSGCWRESSLRTVVGCLFKPLECAVVINGIYYWLDCRKFVLAYDSNTRGRSWDVDIGCVLQLPKPNINILEHHSVLGKSKDGLLQYASGNSLKVVVWIRIPCASNWDRTHPHRWVRRHAVSFRFMCHVNPGILSSCDVISRGKKYKNELYANVPKVVAFHTLDPSVLFMRLNNMIMSFCMKDNKVKEVVLLRDSNLPRKKSWSYPPGGRINRLFPYFSPPWASHRA